jgi:hypothetical protein
MKFPPQYRRTLRIIPSARTGEQRIAKGARRFAPARGRPADNVMLRVLRQPGKRVIHVIVGPGPEVFRQFRIDPVRA